MSTKASLRSHLSPFIYLSLSLSVFFPINRAIPNFSLSLSLSLSRPTFACLSSLLLACLLACLSVCTSVRQSFCLSVYSPCKLVPMVLSSHIPHTVLIVKPLKRQEKNPSENAICLSHLLKIYA